jgi:hypothetical protein
VKRKFVSLASLAVLAVCAGPWTVWAGNDRWTNIGPEEGGVIALAVDPQNSSTVYAGTAVGVFKSDDRGASWRNAGVTGYSVVSLSIDPLDPDTVYAVTGGRPNEDSATTVVFKSTDGGQTWNQVGPEVAGGCCVGDLVIDPVHRGTIYVVAGGGLLKSIDGGTSWEGYNTGLPNNIVVAAAAIDPQNPDTVGSEHRTRRRHQRGRGARAGKPLAFRDYGG